MRHAPSLRRMWRMYKEVLTESRGYDRRDLVLAQGAFYAAARVTWKVLGYLAEDDEPEALMRLIEKRARQVFAIQGMAPRKRRH